MKKKIISDIHVGVYPRIRYRVGVTDIEGIKDICRQIEESIKRHVDDVAQIGTWWDTTWECEFCGNEWEWKDDECPECCLDAEREWLELNQTNVEANT